MLINFLYNGKNWLGTVSAVDYRLKTSTNVYANLFGKSKLTVVIRYIRNSK